MDTEVNLFFIKNVKYLEKVKFGLNIEKLVSLNVVNREFINEFRFLLFVCFWVRLVIILSWAVNALG